MDSGRSDGQAEYRLFQITLAITGPERKDMEQIENAASPAPVHGIVMRPTFDRAGDISDETEKAIKEYTGDPGAWLELCVSCWDQSYGRIGRYKTETELGIEFITGGWSCNELVISTMKQNYLMWALCWESSHRGGLHRFERDKSA